jgi:hypothetical protein
MDAGVSLFELKFCGCGVCGRELLAPGPANVAAANADSPEKVAELIDAGASAW